MKVILFGASGMVGQGALRECLLDPGVTQVVSVGRSPLTLRNPKLLDCVLPDVADLKLAEADLRGAGACFFCLGVSSAGMSEEAYRRLTYNLTLRAAGQLAEWNPGMTFIYVSGSGTDSTELGKSMWARVKGATENALLRLPFKAAYMLRPGMIQPLHGARSKTKAYRVIYFFIAPVLPLLRWLFPRKITTTEQLGRAMLRLAREGFLRPILEVEDLCAM